MGVRGGLFAAGEEVAEGRVAEDVAEAVAGLAEEFFAVGKKREVGTAAREGLAGIVERGDKGFAGAGGGND